MSAPQPKIRFPFGNAYPHVVGSEDNNTYFDENGFMRKVGTATAYRDELQSLIKEAKNNPSDRITDNYAEGTLDFKTTAIPADYAIVNIQINHDWKVGSDVFPHLHWFQAQDEEPNWLIQYRWQSNGAAKTTDWTNSPATGKVFDYTTGTILQISRFAKITPPEGAGLSDILQIRIIRDSDNTSGEFEGADPYTVVAAAVNFDIHIQVNTIGSNQEYIK